MPDRTASKPGESPGNEPGPGGSPSQQPVVTERERSESWFGRLLHRWLGWKTPTIRTDLEVVLAESQSQETGFSPEERAMLKNILSLRERRIEDVMLPRADIVAVQQDISLGELIKVFEKAAHSRLVVYNETLDDAIGMVHIRDLIAFMTARAAVEPESNLRRTGSSQAGLNLAAIDLSLPLSSAKIVRPLLFVPPSMAAIDLLAKMQATRIHLALVIDEYGGNDGLVSMEDLVELVVGDIADEHDEEEAPAVTLQADGSFVAAARASLEDVKSVIGADFDVGDALDAVDTLGGYLVIKAGRVPARGEVLRGPGSFEIEVLDADPRRVKKVKIYRSKQRSERAPEGKPRGGLPSLAKSPSTSAEHPPYERAQAVSLKNARQP